MFDFPNSPTTNQTVTGSGGQVYRYDGTKWVATATAPGVQSFNTRTGAVVLQQSDLVAIGEYNDVGRNLVHNPVYTVAQRGTGPWTTGVYTADRWVASNTTDAMSFTVGPLADTDRSAIGDETAQFCLANTFTGNAATAAFNAVYQPVESIRRLSGKTVTVSFWAVAAAGAPKLGLNFWLIYGTGGSPSPSQYALATGASVAISTTWARYSATMSLPSAAGKTFGTTVGTDNSQLYIAYSSGSSNNAAFGNIGVQSGTVRLWGIQLEIGTVATPLDKGGSPQAVLAECQRFYQVGAGTWGAYTAAGASAAYIPFMFPVLMRAAPSVTFTPSGGGNYSSVTATATAHTLNATVTATALGGTNFNYVFTASADL